MTCMGTLRIRLLCGVVGERHTLALVHRCGNKEVYCSGKLAQHLPA
jgi:hypothetical protein